MRLALLALVLAACGGSSGRPCGESQQARAAGTYDQPGTDLQGVYMAHRRSCEASCESGDQDACVEHALLDARGNFNIDDAKQLIALCQNGNARACTWVEANQERIEANKDWFAGGTGGGGVASTGNPVDDFATQLIATMEDQNMWLRLDQAFSLESGGASTDLYVNMGSFHMVAIADSATTFSGAVGGGGVDGNADLVAIDAPDSLHVMAASFHFETVTDASPWLRLSGDGGTVRVLLFEEP